MQTILVLTDFSYHSFKAARYAFMMARNFKNCRIILHHSFALTPVLADGLLPYPVDIESIQRESANKMKNLAASLEPYKGPDTLVECSTGLSSLKNAVEEIVNSMPVDLIVAGNKGKSPIADFILGRNMTDLINNLQAPLLIIPSKAVYKPIVQAVFPCELKDVEKLPLTEIRKFIREFQCRLSILNIVRKGKEHISTDSILQQTKLHEQMDVEQPEYHYINYPDIEKGILEFSRKQKAGLVIVVHKKHGFFQEMINAGVTKKLAVDTAVPLLILKEID